MTARRAADAGEAQIEAVSLHRKTLWRAQVTGLTAADAQAACTTLARRKIACAPVRLDPGEIASR